MNKVEAISIFLNIESDEYSIQEKGQAIHDVCTMETHNSITKASMLKVIWWLLNLIIDIPKGGDK